jgi:hypothetical protein
MPFPFYNTAPPTPSTKNTINDIAVTYGIRDFLLNRNLAPQYPQISTSINGGPRIGEPVLDTSINGNANVIPIGLPLEVVGLTRYNDAVSPNRFRNDDGLAPSLVNIEDIQQIQGVFGPIDFPQGTSSYPTSPTQTVSDYGLKGKTEYAEFRKISTLRNLYVDASQQIDMGDFITLQPAGFSQQITGYLDEYGGLNLGGGAGEQAANVIGSILNGQGFGLAQGGFVANFDIRSSLAGRVLGLTGLINETKLGIIGAQQLALSLANNAAFNAQQLINSNFNVEDNILSLVKNGNLSGNRPDYRITTSSAQGTLGTAGDLTTRILGFTVPRSFLQENASIFSSENPSTNIDRANAMLENTGSGQMAALITNVFANLNGSGEYDRPESSPFRVGYAPAYAKGEGEKEINPKLYAFYTSDGGKITDVLNPPKPNDSKSPQKDIIPELSYNRSDMIKKYGFLAPEDTFTGPKGNYGYDNRIVSDIGFTWLGADGAVNSSALVGSDVNANPFLPLDTDQSKNALLNNGMSVKKSILTKTQKLFNSKGMMNIVSVKGDMNKKSSQIQTANGGGFSKGSAVIKGDRYKGRSFDYENKTAEETYCRSWTTLDRYDTVSKMIRNSGLTENVYPFRYNIVNSSLDDNGFPKIAPYITDKLSDPKSKTFNGDLQKYMLSIENLAWSDNIANLPPVEIGMGDLTTGKRGRIMWFPPYDISFNETSAPSWESTNFIGRGEPVYTYNNTERSGQLSFSIVVDHSTYTNTFRDNGNFEPDDNYVASFMAGCVEPNSEFANLLTTVEKSYLETENITPAPQQINIDSQIPEVNFNVFFPNDVYELNTFMGRGYENGKQNTPNGAAGTTDIDYSINQTGNNYGIGLLRGQVTPQRSVTFDQGIDVFCNPNNYIRNNGNLSFTEWNDLANYGLNGWKNKFTLGNSEVEGFLDPNLLNRLEGYLNFYCPTCIIKVTGYASPHGCPDTNQKLADERQKAVLNYLKNNLSNVSGGEQRLKYFMGETKQISITESQCNSQDRTDSSRSSKGCKFDRRAGVTIMQSAEYAAEIAKGNQPAQQTIVSGNRVFVKNRYYNEALFFEKLQQEDKFVFDKFRERIRYFHPAFHSMTPEGFNSRLTFLHQCTRQGPTLQNVDTRNLAFGRPPICILRLGDFFHTKVVIDNVSIDYEPLVWDLNPEGIGIQPMIAKVTLGIKFIGGSSLVGPINKLQNALSFNFYGNTQVYDERADYIENEGNTYVVKNGVENINSQSYNEVIKAQQFPTLAPIPPEILKDEQIGSAKPTSEEQ